MQRPPVRSLADGSGTRALAGVGFPIVPTGRRLSCDVVARHWPRRSHCVRTVSEWRRPGDAEYLVARAQRCVSSYILQPGSVARLVGVGTARDPGSRYLLRGSRAPPGRVLSEAFLEAVEEGNIFL